MKRRNAIIGLGGLIAGSGALVGTGAFTSVQANRSVGVQTAGDASAALQIQPTTKAENYINNDSGAGALTLDFGSGTNTENINKNAKTVISPLLNITTNSSTGSIPLEITSGSNTQNNGEDYDVIGYGISETPRAVLTFFIGQTDPPKLQDGYAPTSDSGYVNGRYVDNKGGIEVSNDPVEVGVIIDTRNDISDSGEDISSYDESITIIAGE